MANKLNPTVAERYQFLLTCHESVMKILIDTYNQGRLSIETRTAMEALEAVIFEEERIQKEQEFTDSLTNYLNLYTAGFRITNSKLGEFGGCEINRFWWNGKPIRSFPDIDKIQGEWDAVQYNTMANGHVESLV